MAGESVLQVLIKARDETSHVLDKLNHKAGVLRGSLKALGAITLLGGAAGVAIAKNAVDVTQELGLSVAKLSRVTGMSAEESSRLLFVFQQYNLTADEANSTLGIFAKKLKGVSDAETGVLAGGKSTIAVLNDLGVATVDTTGHLLPTGKILGQLADRFKSMPNGLEKTGLAMQLFGRGGAVMLPVLNAGSAGMRALSEMADKLGVTLTGENIAAIREYSNAHTNMEKAIAGLKLQIGLALMPVLTRFSEWFVAHLPEMRAFVTQGIERATVASAALMGFLEKHQGAITAFFENFKLGLQTIRQVFEYIIRNKVPLIIAISAIGVAIFLALGPVSQAYLAIAGIIILIGWFRRNTEELSASFHALVRDTEAVFGGIANIFRSFVTGLVNAGEQLGIRLVNAIINGLDAMAGAFLQRLRDMRHQAIQMLNPYHWVFGSTMTDVYRAQGEEAGDSLMAAMFSALSAKAELVVGAVKKPLEAMRAAVQSLQGEMSRLAGLNTVESSKEGIKLAELRLKQFDLEAKAEKEKADREAKLAVLQDQLKDATGKWHDNLQKKIDAMEKERGPNERALDALNAQIDALERLAEKRRLERDILVARGVAADHTLVTDQHLLNSMDAMVQTIDTVTAGLAAQSSYIQTIFIPSWMATEDAIGAKGGGGAVGALEAFGDTLDDPFDLSGLDAVDGRIASITRQIREAIDWSDILHGQLQAFGMPTIGTILQNTPPGANPVVPGLPSPAPAPAPAPSGGGWGGGGWGQRGATGNTYINNVNVNGTTESLQGIGAHLN